MDYQDLTPEQRALWESLDKAMDLRADLRIAPMLGVQFVQSYPVQSGPES